MLRIKLVLGAVGWQGEAGVGYSAHNNGQVGAVAAPRVGHYLRGVRRERIGRRVPARPAERGLPGRGYRSWVEASLIALAVVVTLVDIVVVPDADGGHQVERLVARGGRQESGQ